MAWFCQVDELEEADGIDNGQEDIALELAGRVDLRRLLTSMLLQAAACQQDRRPSVRKSVRNST